MNSAKFKVLAASCAYFLLIAFSVGAGATEVDQVSSGVSVETWSSENGRELPILSFEEAQGLNELTNDIRAENIIQDSDGSLRFQLTHSGPMSRQVFANVRRVEQDNGLTRSIITNISDGHQTEYLTRTNDDSLAKKVGVKGDSTLMVQLKNMEDQHTECPMCYLFGILVSEAACAAASSLAHYNCRLDCQRLGGVQSFNSGICGSVNSECACWRKFRKMYEEF